jgi:hypothetical protein
VSDDDEIVRAWKSARTIIGIAASVSAAVALIWWLKGSPAYHLWSLAFAACAAFALSNRLLRGSPAWTNGILFVAAPAVILLANALTNLDLAKAGAHFEAFEAFKIAPLAVAIIAPSPVWAGYLVIALGAFGPLIFYGIHAADLRIALPTQEPWFSPIYASVAWLALRHRLKGIELEKALARTKVARRALEDLATVFLALRDLTNTPLQQIEITAALLETKKLSAPEGALQLRRSLARLKELSSILTTYESEVDRMALGNSFDAAKTIQERLASARDWAHLS